MTEENTTPDNWQMRAEFAEESLRVFHEKNNARLIRAELKAEAIRAGMVDLDGLKLLDFDQVKLTESGEVAEAAILLAKLKRAKPWLFHNSTSSSPTLNPPRPEPLRTRHANELSHEEWIAARAALLRRK